MAFTMGKQRKTKAVQHLTPPHVQTNSTSNTRDKKVNIKVEENAKLIKEEVCEYVEEVSKKGCVKDKVQIINTLRSEERVAIVEDLKKDIKQDDMNMSEA